MTGRTHQIRVHAYALGHPLVEDILYGAQRHVWDSASDAARANVILHSSSDK